MKKEEMKELVNLLNQYEVDFIHEKVSSVTQHLDDYTTPLNYINAVRGMIQDDIEKQIDN